MKFIDRSGWAQWVAIAVIFCSCGKSPSSSKNSVQLEDLPPLAGLPNGSVLPALSGINVMNVTVNGSLCSANSYPNKPCVSVKICNPGTTTCVTVSDILLDTGSFGLRVFKSALGAVNLTPMLSGTAQVAECVEFGDGSKDWGPVAQADVYLAGEAAVPVPIQVVDSTFASTTHCTSPDSSPSQSGFNGILGVGLLAHDCGTACANSTRENLYFGCSGTSCTSIAMPLANQVQNPVALLPVDNNGVILQLPSTTSSGRTSVDGYLVLGIGTQSNNSPSAVTSYRADPSYAEFITRFNHLDFNSIIDSGSNGLFFSAPTGGSLPLCKATDPTYGNWFCPSATATLSAVNRGFLGGSSGTVQFQIGNFISLINSPHAVFSDLGADGGGIFDWGLPFFLGRNVYVGIEGKSSPLGLGPYWAY